MALWCWTGKTVRIPLPPRRGITLPYGGESIERQLDWWGVPLDPLFGESMVGVGSGLCRSRETWRGGRVDEGARLLSE